MNCENLLEKKIINVAKCGLIVYTIVWFYMLPNYALGAVFGALEGEKFMHETNTERTVAREVDIQRLLRMLWKRIWVILAATVVAGILSAVYTSLFITPTYRSNFSAYINNKPVTSETVQTSTSDLSASKGIMYVYKEIVVSRSVLTEAAVECGMQSTLVSSMVKAYVSEDAPILRVYVETEDPDLSQRLAEAIAKVAPQHVSKVVAGSTMTLIDSPITPRNPYSPNVRSNMIYGALVGFALTVIALILVDMIYDKVLEQDDFESRYNLPVVGRIPDLQLAQKNDSRYGSAQERGKR